MNTSLTFSGYVRIQIKSAATNEIIKQMNQLGIALYEISVIDEITAEVTIHKRYLKLIIDRIERRGDQVSVIGKFGIYWTILALRRRLVLLVGIMLFIGLALYLPTRVLFVFVEGNRHLSTESIVSQAEALGIRFGASRREVRSEQMKNGLLSAIPELQWAGVNTYGCVAVISVSERGDITEDSKTVELSGISARYDGVISQITAYRGNVLCRVGQAVKAGNILVSGYTDCGTHIMATSAKAEIYAKTLHSVSSVLPLMRLFRNEKARQETRLSIIIGKNIIKLYNGSGISDTRCVKMYEERCLRLPGGFSLPLAIGIETYLFYEMEEAVLPYEQAELLLKEQTVSYLKKEMVSGTVLSEAVGLRAKDKALLLQGEYYCHEMIGQRCREEIIYDYERNGKNP